VKFLAYGLLFKDKGREKMIINHVLKLQDIYANAICSGEKPFEIRYNDRGYQKGDKIQFCCVERSHEIEKKVYEITYLIHGWGLEKDWCVFGIREIKE
jgi:hypothetical protein